MMSKNDEKILERRQFWKDHLTHNVITDVIGYTPQDLEEELRWEFEVEKQKVHLQHPTKRKTKPKKSNAKQRTKPPVKGAKKRAFEHYCGGEPRCFWPKGCDVKELPMLQLHHINGGGKQHRELLKLVAGNFYVALEIEKYPVGLKPLCANHHIMMHTKNGACWEEYL